MRQEIYFFFPATLQPLTPRDIQPPPPLLLRPGRHRSGSRPDFIPPAGEMNEDSDLTRAEFLGDLSPWLRMQIKEPVWDTWQG